jgi:hypothetical protein
MVLHYRLKLGIVIAPALLFLFSIVLAICSLLHFEMKPRAQFSISVVNFIEILVGIALKIQTAFGGIAIYYVVSASP